MLTGCAEILVGMDAEGNRGVPRAAGTYQTRFCHMARKLTNRKIDRLLGALSEPT
jgi:hypothetical protein